MENPSKNLTWHNGAITTGDRQRILGQRGLVVWFTGLSGSGKSTLAVTVEQELIRRGRFCYRLDGDNLRHGLNRDLGFSAADRDENIRRTAEVAALFKDAGAITLTAFISPFRRGREFARQCAGSEQFLEVYLKTPLETLIARDPKGLYQKALAGEIPEFTGISSAYEEPLTPDITLDTAQLDINQCVSVLLKAILERSRPDSEDARA